MIIGEQTHIASYSKKKGGRKFAEDEAVMAFAQRALAMFHARCNYAIQDGGLNCVDVMWLKSYGMVVNEFESLEACYEGVYDADSVATRCRMKAYWLGKMTSILKVTTDPC